MKREENSNIIGKGWTDGCPKQKDRENVRY